MSSSEETSIKTTHTLEELVIVPKDLPSKAFHYSYKRCRVDDEPKIVVDLINKSSLTISSSLTLYPQVQTPLTIDPSDFSSQQARREVDWFFPEVPSASEYPLASDPPHKLLWKVVKPDSLLQVFVLQKFEHSLDEFLVPKDLSFQNIAFFNLTKLSPIYKPTFSINESKLIFSPLLPPKKSLSLTENDPLTTPFKFTMEYYSGGELVNPEAVSYDYKEEMNLQCKMTIEALEDLEFLVFSSPVEEDSVDTIDAPGSIISTIKGKNEIGAEIDVFEVKLRRLKTKEKWTIERDITRILPGGYHIFNEFKINGISNQEDPISVDLTHAEVETCQEIYIIPPEHLRRSEKVVEGFQGVNTSELIENHSSKVEDLSRPARDIDLDSPSGHQPEPNEKEEVFGETQTIGLSMETSDLIEEETNGPNFGPEKQQETDFPTESVEDQLEANLEESEDEERPEEEDTQPEWLVVSRFRNDSELPLSLGKVVVLHENQNLIVHVYPKPKVLPPGDVFEADCTVEFPNCDDIPPLSQIAEYDLELGVKVRKEVSIYHKGLRFSVNIP